MNEILASVNSPVRVSVSQSITETGPEYIDIQAQFKKQMVDKELNCTIACRKTQKSLENFQKCRNRLIEEQKELISERKRVVDAHFQATGIYDDKSPQYMDERVQSIDIEVASIDNTMATLEDKLHSNSSIIDDDTISNFVDLSWENALNLLRSLDRVELEATLAYFLEDVVVLRAQEEELQQDIDEKENVIESLKQKLFDAQESLFKTIQEAKEKDSLMDVDQVNIKDVSYPPTKSETAIQTNLTTIIDKELEELPKYVPRLLKPAENGIKDVDVSSMAIKQIEETIIPPKNSVDEISVGSKEYPISRGRILLSRNDILSRHRSSSPRHSLISELENVKPSILLAPLKREDSNLENDIQSSVASIKLEEDAPKPRKRYDLLTMAGSDVFKRLANAHTRASQAKVIQRTSLDKEALMQEVIGPAPLDGKKKSLSELEQAWNMEI
jgi:flagellar hook-basal body complex protein FliE